MSDVHIAEVSVAYNGTRVVDRVSVDIPGCSWLGLIGPNGAGKSTLLRSMAGLVPYEGTIVIGGDTAASLSRRRLSQLVAFLPQRPTIPDGVRVVDYVGIGRTPYVSYLGAESASDREVVSTVLDRLDLTEIAHRPVTSLSGGEAQRVVLARALAQQSEILLLDEPTSSLDVGHQQHVLELIDELRVERGLTVVTALHDLTIAGQFAETLVLLDRGRVVGEGSASTVLTQGRIERHYDATVRVVEHEATGLTVIPVRTPRDSDRGAG